MTRVVTGEWAGPSDPQSGDGWQQSILNRMVWPLTCARPVAFGALGGREIVSADRRQDVGPGERVAYQTTAGGNGSEAHRVYHNARVLFEPVAAPAV